MEVGPYDSADMYNKGQKCTRGGGGGWVPLQLTEWAQLASQLSTHLYQSTYTIWKQFIQDSLSNHVHKEMYADVDAAA